MGNTIFYEEADQKCALGEISKGRWQEMRKLLPLLIEFVNQSMDGWAPFNELPEKGEFYYDKLIRDEADILDDVYFVNARELQRLFAWCNFLEQHSGAFALYKPLVEELYKFARWIEYEIS